MGDHFNDYPQTASGSYEKVQLSIRERLTLNLWEIGKEFAYLTDERPMPCKAQDREQFIPQLAAIIAELFPQVLAFQRSQPFGKDKWSHTPSYVGREREKLDVTLRKLGLAALPLQED